MRQSRLISIAVLSLAVLASPVLTAEKKTAGQDVVWEAPDIGKFPVASIALLPVATYNANPEQRQMVENAVGQALKTSGHRWASPFIVRDNLLRAGGDSLLRALNTKLLAQPRLDSLDAPFLSRTLRTRALLTVRADRMEKLELELDQSGRPSTSVHLRAALVDSTGRLLWSANSSETLEGQQQEAGTNIIGVKASGLTTTAVGHTKTAPPFPEVLSKITQRWSEVFPKRARPDSAHTTP